MSDTAGVGNTIKVWLEVIREALVIVAVVVLVAFPQRVVSLLQGYGVSNLKTPIGDISIPQAQQAGGSVDAAQRNVADASAALKSLAPELPSATRAQIDSVTSSLESSVAQLQTPKRVLSAAQTPTGATNSTSSVGSPITGWIYVGHVDVTKAAWSQQPTTVANPTPVFQAGDVLAINDDVYVRADTSGGGPHNQAPVVGVIRAGGKVRVVATPEYAHALRGGWFLWLKVTAL